MVVAYQKVLIHPIKPQNELLLLLLIARQVGDIREFYDLPPLSRPVVMR